MTYHNVLNGLRKDVITRTEAVFYLLGLATKDNVPEMMAALPADLTDGIHQIVMTEGIDLENQWVHGGPQPLTQAGLDALQDWFRKHEPSQND